MKLKQLDYDSDILYTRIYEAKYSPRNSILKGIKDEVVLAQSLYNTLAKAKGLNSVSKLLVSEVQKEALIHSYEVPVKTVDELLVNIKKSQLKFLQSHCSYCLNYPPTTFDHFLPKEHFPEFSVHPENLIPACPICNSRKGTNWMRSGNLLFQNPYFDDFEEREFLIASMTVEGGSVRVEFQLQLNNIPDVSKRAVTDSQFKELGLLSQYTENVNSLLSEIAESIVCYFDGEPDKLMDKIHGEYILNQKKYGANYWKTAVLKTLSSRLDIVELIVAEES